MTAIYESYFCELGERRLCNWASWCAGDTAKKLQMPSQTPFAALYQPDAGDVWAEPGEIEPERLIDDHEAAQVEQAVLKMSDSDSYLLFLCYIRQFPVTSSRRGGPSIVRYMRWNEDAVNAALARIGEFIGQLKL